MRIIHLTVQQEYKPGDMPPSDYLDWHGWADAQRKAGIKQTPCPKCKRWNTPQEMGEINCLECERRD